MNYYLKLSIITIICALFSFLTEAQDSKLSIGIHTNWGISGRFIVEEEDVPESVINVFKEIEKPTLGYGIGATLDYNINSSISLQTGITFSSFNVKSDKKTLVSPITVPIGDKIQYKSNNTYLEIPIRALLNIPIRQSKLQVQLGLSPNINIRNTFKATIFSEGEANTTSSTPETNFREFNLMAEFGIGWEKEITDKWSLYLIPNFKIHTLKTGKEGDLNRHIYFYGINVGTKFQL